MAQCSMHALELLKTPRQPRDHRDLSEPSAPTRKLLHLQLVPRTLGAVRAARLSRVEAGAAPKTHAHLGEQGRGHAVTRSFPRSTRGRR